MKKLLLLSLIIFSLYSCKSEKTSIIINTKGELSTKELLDAWNNAYKALSDSNYNESIDFS